MNARRHNFFTAVGGPVVRNLRGRTLASLRALRGLCAGVVCALSALGTLAEDTNATSRLDYPAFRIIAERNIFNAGRSGRTAANRETRRPVRVEAFALVGTMSYRKGDFAFFDGSNAEYRKALQTNGTIAGYRVAEITPTSVKLERNGQTIEMKVNSEMRREDGGEWRVGARSGSYATGALAAANGSGAATMPTNGEPTAGATASAGTAGDDVLKRLMQQREQELK